MFTKLKNRFVRAFGFCGSVILLAAVLSGALCGLNAANISAERQYEDVRKNTPIKLIVTNLNDTNRDYLAAPNFIYRVFTNEYEANSLVSYVKNVQMKSSLKFSSAKAFETEHGGILAGITDLDISGQLMQGSMELVTWLPGYDSSLLLGKDYLCIVPESWIPEGTDLTQPHAISSVFTHSDPTLLSPNIVERDIQIVGTHKGPENYVYCPLRTVLYLCMNLSKSFELDRVQATLIDNDQLPEVRERAKAWFAEPNSTGERTPWQYTFYFYYTHAMVFDDYQVQTAARTLKLSVMTNEICAWLIFILSACASFFVGFLIIRSRKKEIALMRTLGTPGWRIFLELVLEQLLCLAVGIALGGGLFLWQPAARIGIFAGVYGLSLVLSLILFLNTNLLSNLKEAE